MKIILLIIFSIVIGSSYSQGLQSKLYTISDYVSTIDSGQNQQEDSFSINKQIRVFGINEEIYSTNINYSFQFRYGNILKIARRWKHSNDSIVQRFYYKNHRLIYENEDIISYYAKEQTRDTIYWRGHYYFIKNKLIHFHSNGHGKSEDDRWDPKLDAMKSSKEAQNDVLRYKKGEEIK